MPTNESVTQTKGTAAMAPYLLCLCVAATSGAIQSQTTSGYELDKKNNPVVVASVDTAEQVKAEKSLRKFKKLAQQWRNERGSMSSITEMSMLSPYQKIIGMGNEAVPLILNELRSEGDDPDQWFWALTAITETNPVKPEDQGNFKKMAEAWFAWAEAEGYAG
jgi:hypothetical protein